MTEQERIKELEQQLAQAQQEGAKYQLRYRMLRNENTRLLADNRKAQALLEERLSYASGLEFSGDLDIEAKTRTFLERQKEEGSADA